ncbi:MAG: flagellar biosynthesis protein FlhA [Phycisphaerales bacterium]|nr:flagellar biosynthesis protein FlhA [Phycisphaerales bacterium]
MATTVSKPAIPAWLTGLAKHRGLIVPIGFVMLMFVILVPLPPAIMDVLIVLNIALAVIILLTTIYMAEPLDFSVFPSLLLATTLLRLVLNIASTRLILSADASTPDQAAGVAGSVISAFGDFVAGDNLFVGVVIFLIIVIVQFVVITKGAGRISEVAARFTLDAMPGKQMAIDSDLNAGIIDEKEARKRREAIAQEADFFGAMDGASKFVRGDAIAGIIITAINVAGGFAVGVISRGWPAGQTAEVFTRLTIGDGLTAQIPSFVIAIAAALIVTRSGAKQDLGEQLTGQIISQPKGMLITAGFLAFLAATPLPTIPLLLVASVMAGGALAMQRKTRRAKADDKRKAEAPPAPEPPAVESLLKVDTMELEVGYSLVRLVDAGQGGDLLSRITAVRRQLASEIGLVMPPVRIRDNLQLAATEYRVKIRGAVVSRGAIQADRLLAIDSGIATARLEGEEAREPAFGLPARWIEPSLRTKAETLNYTVVEPSAVLATHITEIVKRHADELLTRDEVSNLVEGLKQKAPKLVEETIPAVVKLGDLQRILGSLLRERVPIRDMETIVEALADWAPKTKDPDILVEYVRNALRRSICDHVAAPAQAGSGDDKARIACVTLDPLLEDQIASHIDRGQHGTTISVPARTAKAMAENVGRGLEKLTGAGHLPVIVASPQVRAAVRQIVEPYVPGVTVLGYNEIVSEVEVESLALIPGLGQGEEVAGSARGAAA